MKFSLTVSLLAFFALFSLCSIGGCSSSRDKIADREYLSKAREGHGKYYEARLQAPVYIKVEKGDLIPPMKVTPGAWTIYEFADIDYYVSTLHLHLATEPSGRSADDLQSSENFVIDMSILLDSSRAELPYEYWVGSLSSDQCKSTSPPADMFAWEDTNRGVYQRTPSRSWIAKRGILLSVKIGSVQQTLLADQSIVLTPDLFWSP